MWRSLVLTRRLSVQLRSIHVASSASVKYAQHQYKSKNRPENLYATIQGTLPIKFVRFLAEFDNENVPSKEMIDQELQSIRSHHIRYILDTLLTKNSFKTLLIILPFLLEKKLIDNKTIIPVVQALTKAWIQLGSTNEIKTLADQLIALLPKEDFIEDLNLMLKLCSNEWPIFDVNPDQLYMFKSHCFQALVAGALRHSDFKQLSLILKNFSSYLIHSDPDLFQLFINCIRPGDSSLLSVYFDHLNGQMINDETFNLIKQVVNKSRCGVMQLSKVVDGKCKVCNGSLAERLLSDAEFETLKSGFSDYLKEGCESNKLGSKIEFYALEKRINAIKQRSNYRSSVVLDALNINQGYSISTADFVDGVRSLKKKYDVIVLIARHKLANDEKVWNLKQDGIEVFSVGKYSKDDMFSIYSAMHLGPDTILISNDRFTDIAHDLRIDDAKVCELFNIWAMNQVVGYKLPLSIFEPNQYSNLLNYSPKSKAGHFIVFSEKYNAGNKLMCLKH